MNSDVYVITRNVIFDLWGLKHPNKSLCSLQLSGVKEKGIFINQKRGGRPVNAEQSVNDIPSQPSTLSLWPPPWDYTSPRNPDKNVVYWFVVNYISIKMKINYKIV